MLKKINARITVLIAVFAAFYTLLRVIPTFPVVGISGGTFTLADALPPFYGVFLGPYLGAFAIVLGTFMSYIYGRPMLFLGLDFLPGVVNAVIVGFLFNRNRFIPVALYTSLLLLFLIHPYTVIFIPIKIFDMEVVVFFAWMHLIVLILLVSPLPFMAVEWTASSGVRNMMMGMASISLIGVMGQHLMGNLLFENVLGLMIRVPPSAFKPIWFTVFWIYPFERLITTAAATLIGTPILRMARPLKWRNYM